MARLVFRAAEKAFLRTYPSRQRCTASSLPIGSSRGGLTSRHLYIYGPARETPPHRYLYLLRDLFASSCGDRELWKFQTGTPTPALTITAPITFYVTTTGTFDELLLDDWVASDGSQGFSADSPAANLSYKINNGSTQTVAVSMICDNLAFDSGPYTANDGVFYINGVFLTAGQTFTILPQTMTFQAVAGFNRPPATFEGNVMMFGVGGFTMSALTPVPEASSLLLFALGALGLCQRRR